MVASNMPTRRRHRLLAFLLPGILLLTACAAPLRYQPAAISPAETAARLEARSLLDPGLKQFLEKNLGSPLTEWPPSTWDLPKLALAALYFNPAMDAARARAAAAEAAIVTAGARPNPTVSLGPGIPAPYLMAFDFEVPVETAGKRGYRVEQAKHLSEAARLDLADTAWKVRGGVRAALVDYFAATRQVDLLRAEENMRSRQVDLVTERLEAGEIARPDWEAVRLALVDNRVALRAAEGHVAETRTALAAAIGVPAAALSGIELSWPDFQELRIQETLSAASIQRDAVLNRLDVRRALEDYAASESALQLEIARQHPDVQIGPGYQFEESDNFFVLGLSAMLPIFNRNQGPIAEAEARRQEAAATFLAAQAQVIAQSEAALASYQTALGQLRQVDESLRKVQQERLQIAQQALRVGESDSLELNAVALESSAIAQTRFTAVIQARRALGELEDAVQRPLEAGDLPPLSPQSPALNGTLKEMKP
jgi:outer membrane protein, heavy metal efflux system